MSQESEAVGTGERIFDFVEAGVINSLLSRVADATGVAVRLADPHGKTLLIKHNFTKVCDNFNHGRRKNLCEKCARKHVGALPRAEPFEIYPCDGGGDKPGVTGAGLWDAVVPIYIGDERVANILCGQVLYEEPDDAQIEKFRAFARNVLGLSEDETQQYVELLGEVPLLAPEEFKAIVELL